MREMQWRELDLFIFDNLQTLVDVAAKTDGQAHKPKKQINSC
jgi:hypothetical protein